MILDPTPHVLVAGGGTAALCAAISARRTGARVSLLEQAPRARRGGNTRHARNFRYAHDTANALSSGPYPAATFLADLQEVTEGETDPLLARLLVERSADLPAWLGGCGVALQPRASGVLPPSRKTAFLLGGGTAMLNALYAEAARLGVAIHYQYALEDPGLDGERVERVGVRDPLGATQHLAPGALILCSGGPHANRDWLARHWGARAAGILNRGTPYSEGRALLRLLEQGAEPVGDPGRAHLVAIDGRAPIDDGGIVTRVRCMPAGIVVDSACRRFLDEGGDTASTRYSRWGQRLIDCPGQIAYLILDAPALRTAPPSLHPPIEAPTPETLAVRLGLDPEALLATLAAYNAAVRPGKTPEAGHTEGLEPPKSGHARALDTPPFAAYPMRPGITFGYQGLAVAPDTRVRLTRGGVVTNLFAAGVAMQPNLIPRGYVSGLALAIGMVFGRIAGEEAANHVLS
ncbi:FAD-dependent tricarballylate dehydrogenase TcuA [Marichromatium bheemlicum]|uniref:FAD-dependent tricarballylate dehydrogenase TcuA n=1 Tax=Marichromatium bheemlicum TaxID=365339 RepID=A0ABX1IAX7_9GAMM|nr:FAD-dependent tricarballylate dehydrogenase TcuA [Marichromatium bheemlicum]NKN34685.1 FAD-dependent tricarballylate dehydrogenase TcuA [Marichromatium bheemlicum]